jgi:hypothetical protein
MGATVTPPAPKTTNQKIAAQKPLVRTLQPNLASGNPSNQADLAALKANPQAYSAPQQAPQAASPLQATPQVPNSPMPVGSNNAPQPTTGTTADQSNGGTTPLGGYQVPQNQTPFSQQVAAEQQAGAGSTATVGRITDLTQQIQQLQQEQAAMTSAQGVGGGDLGPTTGMQAATQANYAGRIASLTQELSSLQPLATTQFAQQTAAAQQMAPMTLNNNLVSPTTGSTVATAPQYSVGTNTQTGAPYAYNQATGLTPGGQPVGPSGTGAQPVAPTDPYYQTLQTYANDLATNQTTAVPSLPPAVLAQVQNMAQQMTKGTFNYNTATGAGAAQSANATTTGTSAVNAYNTVLQKATTDYSNIVAANQSFQSLGNILLSNTAGVSPSSFSDINSVLNSASAKTGSGPVAQYAATIKQVQAAVGSIMAAGNASGSSIPSDVTADANSIIDGSMPISQIIDVMNRIGAEGASYENVLSDKKNTAQNAMNAAAGGGSAAGGSSAASVFGWNG